MGLGMYAASAEQLQWTPQDVAIASGNGTPDGLVYSQQGEYVDANGVSMQDYVYGVDHYAASAPPCGMEAPGFHYQEEMQYHHPVEISQY